VNSAVKLDAIVDSRISQDGRKATGQAARAAATFRLTCLSLLLPEPTRYKAGEKMVNPKSYLVELLEKGGGDSSKSYLSELIMKVLAPSMPDYLLEDTKADIEIMLTLKDREQLKRQLESHTQLLQEIKENVRKTHIGTPYPEMVYAFLGKLYAWIDDIGRLVISAIENKKLDSKKYRDLQNTRDSIFNQWCFILRAEADSSAEKSKQLEKELSEADLASTKPVEIKQNATPAKHWKIIAWAKELYGLTIERITKAYLDKYG